MRRFRTGRPIVFDYAFEDDDGLVEIGPSYGMAVKYQARALRTPPPSYASDGLAVVSPTIANTFTVTLPARIAGIVDLRVSLIDYDSGVTLYSDTLSLEVTDKPIFTVAEFRRSYIDLADATDFPTVEIAYYRDLVETEFEQLTGRSFTQRRGYCYVTADNDAVWVGKHDVDPESFQVRDLATGAICDPTVNGLVLDSNGVLSGLSAAYPTDTEVGIKFMYGMRDTPMDVARAAMVRTRHLMASTESGIPDRATSFMAANGGQFQLATPGRSGYKTGIPEVDAVLNNYQYRILHDVIGFQ